MAVEQEVQVIISASDRFGDVLQNFSGALGPIGVALGVLTTAFVGAGAAAAGGGDSVGHARGQAVSLV